MRKNLIFTFFFSSSFPTFSCSLMSWKSYFLKKILKFFLFMFTILYRPFILCIPTTFQAGKAFDRSGSVCVSQSQLGQRKVFSDKSVPLNLSNISINLAFLCNFCLKIFLKTCNMLIRALPSQKLRICSEIFDETT